jgi:hypothetical protein
MVARSTTTIVKTRHWHLQIPTVAFHRPGNSYKTTGRHSSDAVPGPPWPPSRLTNGAGPVCAFHLWISRCCAGTVDPSGVCAVFEPKLTAVPGSLRLPCREAPPHPIPPGDIHSGVGSQ